MRHSTAVVLTRQSRTGVEVYLVERAPELRFFGGYWAFPGGVIDPVDRRDGDVGLEAALERCALRELFEETGLLPAPLDTAVPPSKRRALREHLLDQDMNADPWLRYSAAVEEARTRLRKITTVTTPAYSSIRHRTPFVHLELPADQEPVVLPGELTQGRFWNVRELTELWREGGLAVVPPALFLLGFLEQGDLELFFDRAGRAGIALEEGQLHRVYFSPGVMVAPLLTPTLPPATTTNTVLVGEDHVYIVDPASGEVSEQARLFETLDRWLGWGRKLEGILLTHHHHDHVGGVREVALRYSIPVLGHPDTLELVDLAGLEVREVNHGDRLELGCSPDGRGGWQLQAYYTPGHAHGHLVFIENRYGAAVVGDLVSTLSTIVIDPPEGHMRTYIKSLESVLSEGIGVLIPAHGPAHQNGRETLKYHLRRRADREAKLIDCLAPRRATLEELLPIVYDDAPDEVMPYAKRSLLAGLQKLLEDGRATLEGERWALSPSTEMPES